MPHTDQIIDQIIWTISTVSPEKTSAAVRAAHLGSVAELRRRVDEKYPCTIQVLSDLEK